MQVVSPRGPTIRHNSIISSWKTWEFQTHMEEHVALPSGQLKDTDSRQCIILENKAGRMKFRTGVKSASKEFVWRSLLESKWGIEPVGDAPTWREYRIHNPSRIVTARSMLMRYEIAILYVLARDYYTGTGAIVDGGPLLGITTNALAKGLLGNPAVLEKSKRIYSFDLFDYIPNVELLETVPNRNGSFFDTYLELNRDYLEQISVAPGDLMQHPWNSGPIEILFIDLAKSWDLNDFVVDQWFPQLIPGAFVIQQDYFSWFTYWLQITMMGLRDHFEFVDYAMGGSAVFRCSKPVPPKMGKALRSLPFEKQEELLELAIRLAPAPGAEVLKAVKACFYLAFDKRDESERLLDSIRVDALTDDWATNFFAVARGSRDAIRDAWKQNATWVPRP